MIPALSVQTSSVSTGDMLAEMLGWAEYGSLLGRLRIETFLI